MKKPPYLENIEDSYEHRFAIAMQDYATPSRYISYYEAFNKVGIRLFRNKWNNREFFARRGSTDMAECNKNKYRLFKNSEDEDLSASRIGAAEYPLVTNLQDGKLKSAYLDHSSGDINPLPQEFWRTHKCAYTRQTGRIKKIPKDRDDRIIPGMDFIVIIERKGLQEIFKCLPKTKAKAKISPNSKNIKEALSQIEAACRTQKRILNRNIFYEGLNYIFSTDFFRDGNTRPHWDDFPSEYKSQRGQKSPKYLNIKRLKKIKLGK